LILLLGVIIFTSCSVTKTLQEDQYLLKKNIVEFEPENPGIDADEVHAVIQPRPNKKFLGLVPIKIWFYNLGTRGKQESGFRVWLREKVGSRPVVYEQAQAENSVTGIENYLDKVGYFNSEASFEMIPLRKRKARVVYTVKPTVPYRIRNISFPSDDSVLTSFLKKESELSKIRPGLIFNAFELDAERERISNILQNNGYYYFDRNFIYYEIDSSLKSFQLDVKLLVKDPQMQSVKDTAGGSYNRRLRYKVRDIFIKSNYDQILSGEGDLDTLLFQVRHIDNHRQPTEYHFIYRNRLKIRPLTITQSVFVKGGDLYSARDVRMTKLRLSEIGLYDYTNLRFKDVDQVDSAGYGSLDCHIDLRRRKLHAFTVEAEGTNRGGRPGIGLNVAYQNNNIFRGSEIFQLRARIALEAQKNLATSGEDVTGDIPFFNTIETSLDASVTFPRFLIPIKQQRFPKYFRPKTTIRTGFGYERRPEYTRNPVFLTFGYDWKESDTKRHIINPFDWNIVSVDLSPDFQEQIDEEPNDRIRNQYTDHIITAITYNFIFNNQDIKTLKNFFFFRGGAETGGNLLYAGSLLFGNKADSLDYYTLGGIRYSQYARFDADFRFYNVVTRNTTVVYRLFAGIGIPFGNAVVLPLEKGFYGGGANGMRGWPLRLLGPGSYSNPDDNFDKMGDIQIEANLEYRFPVYKFFKLGLFLDVGNIWLLSENTSYPGGEFKVNKFLKDFAIDGGIGVRLDFNFFILRIDSAIPFKDPALPEGQRWTFNDWQFRDVLVSFGIGYPF